MTRTERRTALRERAERYAKSMLGWSEARAVEARPADRWGAATAVLIDPGPEGGPPFVLAYDEGDRLVTDAGEPRDFGWDEEEVADE